MRLPRTNRFKGRLPSYPYTSFLPKVPLLPLELTAAPVPSPPVRPWPVLLGRLIVSASSALIRPFDFEELAQASAHSPAAGSSGIDGIPYEALLFLFRTNSLRNLVTLVYNQALSKGVFPPSWSSTCTVFLPEKGNLNLLQNWRPISLINTDAKIFARLLTQRMIRRCSSIIYP